MTTPTITLTDGTINIPLVYNVANQYRFKALYGARVTPGEPVPMWHESEDAAPRLVSLRDTNRAGYFELNVENKNGTYKDDDVLNALTVLRRWVDGAAQQAARAEIVGDVVPIYLKVQRADGSVATYHRVIYGYVNDESAHYDAPSTLNNIAFGVVLYLVLAPYGQALNAISLNNYVRNPNFDFESATSGLASYWSKNGSPTVTLDTGIKLFGTQSSKIVATSADEGILCNTVTNASDTAAVCYAWLYVTSGTAIVRLYDVDGTSTVASATIDATDSGGNSDMSRTDSGGRTWYRVPVSYGSLTAGNDVSLRIYSSGGAATFYVNGAYLELGTTTAPDAWCSYRGLYNRGDQTTAQPNYLNTFDVWGVPGDAPAVLTMNVTTDALTRFVNICSWFDGRLPASSLTHWYENISILASSATISTVTDAARSNGEYERATVSTDDELSVSVTLADDDVILDTFRRPYNVWIVARSSDVSSVYFVGEGQRADLSTDDTWELLKVYSSPGKTVNEAQTGQSPAQFSAYITTGTSMTVDIDAIIVQFVDQNVIFSAPTAGTYIMYGAKRAGFLTGLSLPCGLLGSLWQVMPGVLNRFMFLAWTTAYAHALTDEFTVTADVLPQTRHLLGTM